MLAPQSDLLSNRFRRVGRRGPSGAPRGRAKRAGSVRGRRCATAVGQQVGRAGDLRRLGVDDGAGEAANGRQCRVCRRLLGQALRAMIVADHEPQELDVEKPAGSPPQFGEFGLHGHFGHRHGGHQRTHVHTYVPGCAHPGHRHPTRERWIAHRPSQPCIRPTWLGCLEEMSKAAWRTAASALHSRARVGSACRRSPGPQVSRAPLDASRTCHPDGGGGRAGARPRPFCSGQPGTGQSSASYFPPTTHKVWQRPLESAEVASTH